MDVRPVIRISQLARQRSCTSIHDGRQGKAEDVIKAELDPFRLPFHAQLWLRLSCLVEYSCRSSASIQNADLAT